MSSSKKKDGIWTKIKHFGRKKKKDEGGADDAEELVAAITKKVDIWTKIKQIVRKKEKQVGGADYEGPFDWDRELEGHRYGDVSIAVAKGNLILEDHSQVESHDDIVFVGVYDGYNGPQASNYICENLYRHFLRRSKRQLSVTEVLGSAILATEKEFLSLVEPSIEKAGSCCLVGVIQRETLYVANLGDSRAVLGFLDKTNRIVAHQLNKIHNAEEKEVREKIIRSHPYGPLLVAKRNREWLIRGINEVSRAIGDAYLKNPAYFSIPSHPLSDLPEQLRQPVLTAEPELVTRIVKDGDRFLIFASHGFWEHISNEEAVDFVHTNPPRGIARELLKEVLTRIAETRDYTYNYLVEHFRKDLRWLAHGDITVVVVFIDYNRLCDKHISVPPLSIRGFSGRSSKHGTGKGETSKQGGPSNQSGSSKDKAESSKKDRASKISKWIKNVWVTKNIRNDKGRSSKHEIEKGKSLKQGGSSEEGGSLISQIEREWAKHEGSSDESGSSKHKDQSSEMRLDKGKQPAWD